MVEIWHPLTEVTKSDLEIAFLEICQKFCIDEPLVNRHLLGKEVDCHWPGTRLVVELDGYEYHRGRMLFERDMDKDNFLKAGGFSVVHFSDFMLTHEAEEVAALVKQQLELEAI